GVVLEQRLAEATNTAQRRAQVVRDRVGERLELSVGGGQLGGALHHPPLEVCVELPDLLVGLLTLGDVLEGHDSADDAAFVANRRTYVLDLEATAIFAPPDIIRGTMDTLIPEGRVDRTDVRRDRIAI